MTGFAVLTPDAIHTKLIRHTKPVLKEKTQGNEKEQAGLAALLMAVKPDGNSQRRGKQHQQDQITQAGFFLMELPEPAGNRNQQIQMESQDNDMSPGQSCHHQHK